MKKVNPWPLSCTQKIQTKKPTFRVQKAVFRITLTKSPISNFDQKKVIKKPNICRIYVQNTSRTQFFVKAFFCHEKKELSHEKNLNNKRA